MTNLNMRHYKPSETKCEVCASSVSYQQFLDHQNQASLVCHSPECNRIVGVKVSNPYLFKNQVEFYRRILEFRQEEQRRKEAYKIRIGEQELSENQLILKSVLELLPGYEEREPRAVTIPSGLTKQVDVSEERLAAYKAHLESIIEKVVSADPDDDAVVVDNMDPEKTGSSIEASDNSPELRPIRENLCSLCKGGCCSRGANNAYLSDATIRRVLEEQPELSAQDILSEYISRINEQTSDGSCINQTKTGCGLPRRLRSDTCNDFFCTPLRKLKNKTDSASLPISILAINRSNTLWERFDDSFDNEITGVFMVQEDGTQPIEIDTLACKCRD